MDVKAQKWHFSKVSTEAHCTVIFRCIILILADYRPGSQRSGAKNRMKLSKTAQFVRSSYVLKTFFGPKNFAHCKKNFSRVLDRNG
jgi:hypothetical protein